MKNLYLFLFFVLFCQNNLKAQSPINVIIAGECSNVSGTYIFNGLVNGKNNYTKTFLIEGENVVIGVGFDNVKWVLYANGDITDDGFSNIAVPVGSAPPFTGWVNTGCADGTMIIEQVLSTSNVEFFGSQIALYPNPSANFIIIENSKDINSSFEYGITDIVGRIVGRGKANFKDKIFVENLPKGNYFIGIHSDMGEIVTKKFIKN